MRLRSSACECRQHNVTHRIEFRQGDLLDGVDEKAHIIASNLPYVSESEYDQLDPTVRDQEPRLALVGGDERAGVNRTIDWTIETPPY